MGLVTLLERFMAFTEFTANPDQLATALLAANAGIEVLSPVSLTASAASAVNYYDGSITELGIGAGLLLTSGYAPGLSNDVGWDGQDNSGVSGFDNGDVQIDTVVNTVFQTQSYDATSLEFDFRATDPNATSISFDLVFGSEEYPEWVDAFVDCAVVIVNGVNYALFNHDPNAPLSVISANLAAGYFQDNAGNVLSIQYDGVSHVLKIVAPIRGNGEVNHIKIGIADTGDHILDSGIFIANLSAGNIPGSGVVEVPNCGTIGDDSVTGSQQNELLDLLEGNDTAYAGGGDDIVVAGAGDDSVFGGSGADQIEGDAGNDHIDGGSEIDTAVYLGQHADFTVSANGSTLQLSSLAEGVDTLTNIEFVQFKDGLYAVEGGALVAVDITPPPPANAPGSVVISGVTVPGKTLTAIVIDADGVDTASVSGQWWSSADGVSWSDTGIVGTQYTVGDADLGLQFQVSVAYTDQAGNAEAVTSAAVTIAQASTEMVIDPMVITAPAGATVMNPLTTLIHDAVALGYSPNVAAAAVKQVLGVAADTNLATYDAWALLQDNPADAGALAYLKTLAQVAMTASVSDPTGVNLALAVMQAAEAGGVLDLTDAGDLLLVGVDEVSLDVVQGLNLDVADAKDLAKLQKTWDDWAGQLDNLKPFLGHMEVISVHVNQAPQGLATAQPETAAGVALALDAALLLQGFTDPDGGTLAVSGLSPDQGGSVAQQPDGTWLFTPDTGFSGPVELSYWVDDGQGATVAATVMLVVSAPVTPANQAPILSGTPATLAAGTEDKAYTVTAASLLAGYSDADGDPLAVAQLDSSTGTVTDLGNGSFSITPAANANGLVTLSYQVVDGQGGATAASQSFTLKAVNDVHTGGASVTGQAHLGQTLSAGHTLADVDGLGPLSYQWLANGSAIGGQTGSTLVLGQAQLGKAIAVRITYTDAQGTVEGATSTATAAVLNGQTVGTSGADTLMGSYGADVLSAQGGTDVYYVNHAGDSVVEAAGGGTDTVYSYLAAYTLAANVEAGRVMNASGGSLTGNALDNTLLSGTGTDVLDGAVGSDTASYLRINGAVQVSLDVAGPQATGSAGTDTLLNIENLTGSNFDDRLTGNAGANLLDGGTGNDTTVGGLGNDIHCVREAGDVVVEDASGGNDTVRSYLSSHTLAANVENGRIMLDGSANLAGNGLDNLLHAGSGNNLIDGGAGKDTVSYLYAGAAVQINLGVTGLQATGGSGVDSLVNVERVAGSNFGDTLTGSSGGNLLAGGLGADTLTGGAGSDVFDFNALNELAVTAAGSDVITDFVHGQDRIDLATLDADTATAGVNDAFVFLGTAAAFTGVGQLRYDAVNGLLYGNTDADLEAEFVITLTGVSTLTAPDFAL